VFAALLLAAFTPAPAEAAAQWAGGTYPLPNGEHVSVYVSTQYPDPVALAQKWASYFGSLPHGSELALLTAYVAPIGEVQQMCSNDDVFGCYGGDELVTAGETTPWLPPATSLAAHEYGHHIAAHRNNAPWRALDWGTKRWATRMDVCGRVVAGTATPGDEGLDYAFNPGEAFAETYRVLVETDGAAAGFDWPIVDSSFRPDDAALAALRADVVDPWTGPTIETVHTRFKRWAHRWRTTLETALDGDLSIRIDVPDDVSLVSEDGRTVLARSTWTSAGDKEVHYRVCGVRHVQVRVSRSGPRAGFTLRITTP
jgi:hypothetical protein